MSLKITNNLIKIFFIIYLNGVIHAVADTCKESFSYLTEQEKKIFEPLDIVFPDPINIIKQCKNGPSCIIFEVFHKGQFLHEVNIPADYLIGMEGYARMSKEYFHGDMYLTNFILSTKMHPKEYQKLKWMKYHGRVEEFLKIRQMVVDQNRQLKSIVIGPEGLLSVGEKYFKGNLQITFSKIQSILNYQERKQIEWNYFNGNNIEFRKLRHKLLNNKNQLRYPFASPNGFLHILKFFPKQSMDQIFIKVLSVLGADNFRKLHFPMFIGFSTDFYQIQKDFLSPNGEVKEIYIGNEGWERANKHYAYQLESFFFPYKNKNYTDISNRYSSNDVTVKNKGFVYYNVLAVLGPTQFAQLKWPTLHSDFMNKYKDYFLNKGYTNKLFEHFSFFNQDSDNLGQVQNKLISP